MEGVLCLEDCLELLFVLEESMSTCFLIGSLDRMKGVEESLLVFSILKVMFSG